MDPTIWLPALLLGLAAVGLMFLFVEACDKVRGHSMIWLTALVTLLLFAYLLVALLRPERF
jgi:K+-transporting ATPase KdpF subunit